MSDLILSGAGSLEPTDPTPAMVAAATKAAAMVNARYGMALKRPRSEARALERLSNACKDRRFAESAEYRLPVGKGITGPSIRFAEEALRAWGNVEVLVDVMADDPEERTVNVTILDLEANLSYSRAISFAKVAERRELKPKEVALGERVSRTSGEVVYLVPVDEGTLLRMQQAQVSKAIRSEGLRLIPSWIVREALDLARATLRKSDAEDPRAAMKKLSGAFSEIGISVAKLERHVGAALGDLSPDQIQELRELYVAIREGDLTWGDVERAAGAAAEASGENQAAAKVDEARARVRAQKMGAKAPAGPAAKAEPATAAKAQPDARTRPTGKPPAPAREPRGKVVDVEPEDLEEAGGEASIAASPEGWGDSGEPTEEEAALIAEEEARLARGEGQ